MASNAKRGLIDCSRGNETGLLQQSDRRGPIASAQPTAAKPTDGLNFPLRCSHKGPVSRGRMRDKAPVGQIDTQVPQKVQEEFSSAQVRERWLAGT